MLEMADVVEDLNARLPEHDMVATVDRVAKVAQLLGDPQESFRIVHITGTNGKTSTARMVESLVRGTGLRTGLFTSPHLHSVTERIRVDGCPIDGDVFVAAYEEVRPYVDLVDAEEEFAGRSRMTFFEVLTCLALAVFADAPVDVAVLEVGLGGTWDATNVATGDVAVVTTVSLDHQDRLGDTVERIASEKAGIIKARSRAVVGQQSSAVERILIDRCREVGAIYFRLGTDFDVVRRAVAVGGQVVTIRTVRGAYEDLFIPAFGHYQAANAACAIVAVEELLTEGRPLDDQIVAGLGEVELPARLEIVSRGPTVVVDAAHNPAGAAALVVAVAESYAFESLIGVIAVFADKDVRGLLTELRPLLDCVVVTRNSSERCMPADKLAALAGEVWGPDRVQVRWNLAEAVELARALAEDAGGGVLVTGSVVTAAEARALFAAGAGGPPADGVASVP